MDVGSSRNREVSRKVINSTSITTQHRLEDGIACTNQYSPSECSIDEVTEYFYR